jgi:23S rRNA pseudouridine2605 synthase
MRINKFITSNTEISRRKADQLILEGKVFLNGKKIEKPGITIDPETDIIKIGGKMIHPNQQKEYFALNKPKGYIATRQDELMRKTIMELIPKGKNLKPVGRLDKDSEGLLLISNDGDFINKLTHPKFECEKEYYVKIKKEVTDEDIEKLEKGIKIEGRKTAPAKLKIKNRTENETILTITIHEGRNRQVRKMFASLGYNVKYLQRIRIGKIKLGRLEKGKYRSLTPKEINVN